MPPATTVSTASLTVAAASSFAARRSGSSSTPANATSRREPDLVLERAQRTSARVLFAARGGVVGGRFGRLQVQQSGRREPHAGGAIGERVVDSPDERGPIALAGHEGP